MILIFTHLCFELKSEKRKAVQRDGNRTTDLARNSYTDWAALT